MVGTIGNGANKKDTTGFSAKGFKSKGFVSGKKIKKKKKALPLSATAKGVTARIGKGYKRVPKIGDITAHESVGVASKRKTYKGAGKPLDKGRSKLRKRRVG